MERKRGFYLGGPASPERPWHIDAGVDGTFRHVGEGVGHGSEQLLGLPAKGIGRLA